MAYGFDLFDLQEEEIKSYGCFFCDAGHGYPPLTPTSAWAFCDGVGAEGFDHGAEEVSAPYSRGGPWRLKDGVLYFSAHVTKEEDVPERKRIFLEKTEVRIKNYKELWQKDVDTLLDIYRPFQQVDIEKISNFELKNLITDWYYICHRRQWQIHTIWMLWVYNVLDIFSQQCEQFLNLKFGDPELKALLTGYDNKMVETNRAIWRLGGRIRELGLVDVLSSSQDDNKVMDELNKSDSGKKFMEEFKTFLDEYGWRSQRIVELASKTWISDPGLVIALIRQAVQTGGEFLPDEATKSAAEKRQVLEKELTSRVPAERRGEFQKLMEVGQWCGVWSENHTFYCEMMCYSTGHKLYAEIGKRFAEAGVIDDPFHVYMLTVWEIRRSLIGMGYTSLKKIARKRLEEWEGYLKLPTPTMIVGTPERIPLILKEFFLQLNAMMPTAKPELNADLYGVASSGGIAEGIARVAICYEDFQEVQTGQILVASMISPSEAHVFNFVSGVVTDSGGVTAHPMIVAREYEIPCIVGTMEATKKIKTGMKLRIDGQTGAVYILGS